MQCNIIINAKLSALPAHFGLWVLPLRSWGHSGLCFYAWKYEKGVLSMAWLSLGCGAALV